MAWTPTPAMPMEGPLAPNTRLQQAARVADGAIYGPEDVDLDGAGRLVAALEDGRVVRILDDGRVEPWVQTGGRPLGLDFDARGNLWICDARRGLLMATPQGELSTVATEADGLPFGFADDVDVATDGTVYFSDASWRWAYPDYMYDLFEGRPYGRLLRYDPRTEETTVLASDMYFANGVALASDESFVLVNETFRARVMRVWLKGPRAGTREVFIDGLPGYPDGVASDGQGRFYVAMGSILNPLGDVLATRPWTRRLVARLPSALWPRPLRYGLVVVLDEDGEVVDSLHDPSGETIFEVTSAQPSARGLLLGNLHDDALHVLEYAPGKADGAN